LDNTDAGKLLSGGEISSVPQSVDERRDFIQQIPRRIVSEGRRVCPSVNTYALPPKAQTFVAPLLGGSGGFYPSGSTLATFLNSSSPLDDFKKYMSVYIMNRHKGAARKAEVANYIRGGIDGDIKKIDAQVEPNSAGSCGE
jgi:hypothetical protein